MNGRRTFLKNALITTAAVSVAGCTASAVEPKDEKTSKKNPNSHPGIPLAIATWPNLRATDLAMQAIVFGGSALDAVEAGAKVPEADAGDSSVGYGGLPDKTGVVTLDACIMDDKGNAGSVTFLQHILHPISVARRVMEKTPHVMLSGEGALQFALEEGFKTQDLMTDSSRVAWNKYREEMQGKAIGEANHDTIGILAIDRQNRISGACSTSGAAWKMHGRVGDSPIIGAGLYVDNEVGAATSTGLGELVMKTVGSFLIVELMRNGATPQEACETAVRRIRDKYFADGGKDVPQVGFIAVNKAGEHGAYSLVNGFSYSLYQGETNEVYEAESLINAG
ncbi:MAG: N(4)-(beta-N-acetylglucosaminyl)-L-asparaginase [Lewinellaceae bacterium]|nr:N(4)-(beta-N-acetylglucosaminyl)-L-asparaginase [Lewinella sp.]MCB9281817.1 N(4)-(beta-N-acetylglucosaminyl)-L-asparaginase [Lewinellaceae bacterium]